MFVIVPDIIDYLGEEHLLPGNGRAVAVVLRGRIANHLNTSWWIALVTLPTWDEERFDC